MCGIAGYYAFGSKLPSIGAVSNLLVATQERGTDATGVSYIENGALQVLKAPVRASEFVKSTDWGRISLPKIMIMHCRATTQGSEKENMNNHPLFSKSGIAVVHNGIIRNDDDLFKTFSLTRDAKVDSEIFPKLLEKVCGDWDLGMKLMNKVEGGFACAAIQKKRPTELAIWRHNNPVVFAYDKEHDILYFASTFGILEAVTSMPVKVRGFSLKMGDERFVTWEMSDDTGVIIGPSGKTKDYALAPPKYSYANVGWEQEWNRKWGWRDNDRETAAVIEPTDECEFCGVDNGTWIESLQTFICNDCLAQYATAQRCNPCCLDDDNIDTDGSCTVCGNAIECYDNNTGETVDKFID